MPVYNYRCRNSGCRHEFEQYNEIDNRANADCPECGTAADKLILPPLAGGFTARRVELWNKARKKFEYVEVSSRDQLVRECNKRGLIHRGYSYHDKEEHP